MTKNVTARSPSAGSTTTGKIPPAPPLPNDGATEHADAAAFPDGAEYQQREGETAQVAVSNVEAGYPVTHAEIVFGMIAVAAWLLFFVTGTVIGTADDRELLDSRDFESTWTVLLSLFTILTCYTITNVAFLACLAAIAGEFSWRSRLSSLVTTSSAATDAPQFREVLACYGAAAMRGFVIYLLFIAGLLLVTTEAIANADQAQYVRVAGTVSVLSFVAGYDAEMFRRALDRVVSLISQSQSSDRSKPS